MFGRLCNQSANSHNITYAIPLSGKGKQDEFNFPQRLARPEFSPQLAALGEATIVFRTSQSAGVPKAWTPCIMSRISGFPVSPHMGEAGVGQRSGGFGPSLIAFRPVGAFKDSRTIAVGVLESRPCP